jgi:integral membrane protein
VLVPVPLLRTYQAFAYATGVLLLTLTIVSVPYWVQGLDTPEWLGILWTLHGWFYMGYVFAGLTLAVRLRWSVGRSILVLLAGTVPGMSFVAERWVVRQVRTPAPA